MAALGSGRPGRCRCIIWPLLCGLAKAKYCLLTCKPLTGEEAERIGLVSLCVEDADLQNAALGTAVELANGAPMRRPPDVNTPLNNWLRANGLLFDTSAALEMLGFTGPGSTGRPDRARGETGSRPFLPIARSYPWLGTLL